MSADFPSISEVLLFSPRPAADHAFDELARFLEPVVAPVKLRVLGRRWRDRYPPRHRAALIAGGGDETLELLQSMEPPQGWKWFHLTASGPDHMADWGSLPGNPLRTYSRGVNARSMAEWALGAILHFYRDFDLYVLAAQQGCWERNWAQELGGRTLVVLGAGHAGSELARIAGALGMRTLGINRSGEPVVGFDEVYAADSPDGAADRAWREADVVVVLLPLTDATRGSVDRERIRALPQNSLLLVASRGGIVDEDAVLEAVRDAHLSGAAFDVFATEPLPPDSELWYDSNILVTPHVAGTTDRFMERTAVILEKIWRALHEDPDLTRIEDYRYRPSEEE